MKKIYFSQIGFKAIEQVATSILNYSEGRPRRASGAYKGICEHREQGRDKAVIQKTKGLRGFTLIEIIIFITVISIVASAILVAFITTIRSAPIAHQQTLATQTAVRCAEWFRGQRNLVGFNSIPCPSGAVPNFCTAPNNYNIAVTCGLVDYNSVPNINFKTITITVGGLGDTTLKLLLANY